MYATLVLVYRPALYVYGRATRPDGDSVSLCAKRMVALAAIVTEQLNMYRVNKLIKIKKRIAHTHTQSHICMYVVR